MKMIALVVWKLTIQSFDIGTEKCETVMVKPFRTRCPLIFSVILYSFKASHLSAVRLCS